MFAEHTSVVSALRDQNITKDNDYESCGRPERSDSWPLPSDDRSVI